MNVFLNTFIQILYFIGSIYLFGFLISRLRNKFHSIVSNEGICRAISIIGTPVHELSHALMCVIFGHKILEIKLFQYKDDDERLGYVSHSYNPKNIYHLVGNYFIGVAPIIVGSLVVCLFMRLLLPGAFTEISQHISNIVTTSEYGFSFSIFLSVFKVIKALFTNITSFFGWLVFILLFTSISMHMSLSKQDIKGSLIALPILSGVIFLANVIVRIISKKAYEGFTDFMHTAGAYLISILMLSLIFALIIVLITKLISFLINLRR